MSVYQYVKVWEHEFKPAHKLVMLCLADHADKNGRRIFPGFKRIARMTGYKYRNIQIIMSELREMGVVEVVREHTPEYPAEYRLNWDRATPIPELPLQDELEDTYSNKVTQNLRDAEFASEPSRLLKDQKIKTPMNTDSSKLPTVTPIRSSQKKSLRDEVLAIYAEYKRPEWINHRSLSEQAVKHLKQFWRELKKLGMNDDAERLAAFAVAVRQAAREGWTQTNLTMDNLGTKGKWFQFYEKGLAAGLGVSGAGAESPFNPPPTSGVGTSVSQPSPVAPVAISRREAASLKAVRATWKDPNTAIVYSGRVRGVVVYADPNNQDTPALVAYYVVEIDKILDFGYMDDPEPFEEEIGTTTKLTPDEFLTFERSESESE